MLTILAEAARTVRKANINPLVFPCISRKLVHKRKESNMIPLTNASTLSIIITASPPSRNIILNMNPLIIEYELQASVMILHTATAVKMKYIYVSPKLYPFFLGLFYNSNNAWTKAKFCTLTKTPLLTIATVYIFSSSIDSPWPHKVIATIRRI